MKSKDDIQKEIINTIVDANCRGIILSSVRSGKTRCLLLSIKNHSIKKQPTKSHY